MMTKAEIESTKCGVLSIKLLSAGRLTLPDPNLNRETWSKKWRPYAIAEVQGFQLSSEALSSFPEKGDVSWIAGYRPFKFDVFQSRRSLSMEEKEGAKEELAISLFVAPREMNASTGLSPREEIQSRSLFLGSATVKPLLLSPGRHKVVLKNGAGRLSIEIAYAEKALSPLTTRDDWMVRKGNQHTSGWDLVHIEKKDSGRSYGMEVINPTNLLHGVNSETVVNVAPSLNMASGIDHPFLAPLKFAFPSAEGQLELLSPLGSGGYLSDHLQRERRFGIVAARFYAAELVCILEYLHAKNIIVGCLKMENILLDSFGHVSLCKPSLFAVELSNDGEGDCILPGTAPYSAPEALSSESKRAIHGDWWSLGVILYELLTGAPPFYHKDIAQRRQKVIHDDLHLPATLPPSAKDILIKLLEKNAANRLGANGAADVKAHPFFAGLDWEELLLRRLEPPFKPHDATVVLWREPHTYKEKHREGPKGEIREMGGWLVEMTGDSDWQFPRFICLLRLEGSKCKVHKTASKDDYDLIWETADGESEFYFRNRLTGERTLARRKGTEKSETSLSAVALSASASASEHPTEGQKQKALIAAMEAGYGIGVFSQLLDHNLNLNTQLLNCTLRYGEPTTALEWAVEDERLDLVHLFLDHGADADFTIPCREGSALVRAVTRKLHSIVEVLVPRTTDRVARTRALALAVEQEDISLVMTLLAHGAACDFEESDRPPPQHPFFWDYCESRALEEVHVTPPLVRAARLGNLAIIKLLLDHGADPNVAYHDLGGWNNYKELGDEWKDRVNISDLNIPAMFSCGRAVQIAMESGFPEIARVLVEAGADVELAQPVWDVLNHVCQPVPRGAYLEILDRLRGLVAGIGSER